MQQQYVWETQNTIDFGSSKYMTQYYKGSRSIK